MSRPGIPLRLLRKITTRPPMILRERFNSMATAYNIKITPENTGLWHFSQSEAAASKATELLQQDLEKYHAMFSDLGYHNHISHQVLAMFGTGASVEDMVKSYDQNTSYQRPATKARESFVKELQDWEAAKKRLGKYQYYNDWLLFFQHEIERLGWQGALNEYLFKGDERSDDMLGRLFAGVLHPLIQLMYGVEWQQPAIVAMAMAQACIHNDDLKRFFLEAEAQAKVEDSVPMPGIVHLLEEAAANEKLQTSSRLGDSNTIRDGVFKRAWDDAIKLAGQVEVQPEDLDERTAEMYNATIYQAIAAAIHPTKYPKIDFSYMHHVTGSPIFVALNKQDWLSTENKIRLLEWKIRLDLIDYVAKGSPKLSVDSIASYVPTEESPRPFIVRLSDNRVGAELLDRMHRSQIDDCHIIKLFRAIGIARDINKPYEDSEWTKIKGDDLWDKVGHVVADSVEAPGPTWVRSTGFDESWKMIADRPQVNKGPL